MTSVSSIRVCTPEIYKDSNVISHQIAKSKTVLHNRLKAAPTMIQNYYRSQTKLGQGNVLSVHRRGGAMQGDGAVQGNVVHNRK